MRAILEDIIAEAYKEEGYTENDARDTLSRLVRPTADPDPVDERMVIGAPVGRHVVWATFSNSAPNSLPFDALEHTTACIRTSLGLGHCNPADVLVLIAYRALGLELHRPTVADAGDHEWYHPCEDANESHGWTEPLTPNPRRWPPKPKPEVVHRVVTGDAMVFPIHATEVA